MPVDEAGYEKLSNEWNAISIRKNGHVLLPGTILAGDGLVIRIRMPSLKDRESDSGLPTAVFMNRKGFPGLIVQGFLFIYFMYYLYSLFFALFILFLIQKVFATLTLVLCISKSAGQEQHLTLHAIAKQIYTGNLGIMISLDSSIWCLTMLIPPYQEISILHHLPNVN